MTAPGYEELDRALRDAEWLARVRELRNAAPESCDDPTLLRRLAKDVRTELQANRGGTAVRRAAAGLIFARRKLHRSVTLSGRLRMTLDADRSCTGFSRSWRV